MSKKFTLEGRDIVVAQLTEAQGLAEILKALATQEGPSLVRLSHFGAVVAYRAVAQYAGEMLDILKGKLPLEDVKIPEEQK